MADFYGALSSTSFRIKDETAWLADPDVKKIKAHIESEEGFFDKAEDGYWSFGWYGQYPGVILTSFEEDDDGVEEEIELDVTEVIKRHIKPGDVCKIGVSGNEKLRYIGGMLHWVSSNGIVSYNAQTSWQEKLRTPSTIKALAALVEELGTLA